MTRPAAQTLHLAANHQRRGESQHKRTFSAAFACTLVHIERRLQVFFALPHAALAPAQLQYELAAIAQLD
jgi:hypothetical protein